MLRKLSLIGLTVALAAGCTATHGGAERWNEFDNGTLSVQPDSRQSSFTFIRPAGGNAPAVNISVNGEYLTSLLPGGAQSTIVCSGNVNITAAYVEQDKRYAQKAAQQGLRVQAQGGESYYFQVNAEQNRPELAAQTAEDAQVALSQVRRQAHTVPRISKQQTAACSVN